MDELLPDSIVNEHYRIIKKLGNGGFGQVFLAEDLIVNGHKVAIKKMSDSGSSAQQKLITEMEYLAGLNHPNIVKFLHHFHKDQTLYLVMEYCSGGNLHDQIKKGAFSISNAFELAGKLAQVLIYVHNYNICHHDLKPLNILFDQSRQPKLGDFGVANQNIGTINYMPPENFFANYQKNPQDPRIDIYALGITIVEMLLGNDPFYRFSFDELLYSKINQLFIDNNWDNWVKEILIKATHPTPELRFQTMQDFLEAIESHYVPYFFSINKISIFQHVEKAKRLVKMKKYKKAREALDYILTNHPDCVPALELAGKTALLVNNNQKAKEYLTQAIRINPRINVQKELGWLFLEDGEYAKAISLLNDHLYRCGNDYEAYNLLIKCYFLTERYQIAAKLSEDIYRVIKRYTYFKNNYFICQYLTNASESFRHGIDVNQEKNAILNYNYNVIFEEPKSWDENNGPQLKSKLLFHDFQLCVDFSNVHYSFIIIDQKGKKHHFYDQLLSIGRFRSNDLPIINHNTISRRHCLLINTGEGVWIYDLNSYYGVYCDGEKINKKKYLEYIHEIKIADYCFQLKVPAFFGDSESAEIVLISE